MTRVLIHPGAAGTLAPERLYEEAARMLEMADQVEVAEGRLRDMILDALERGDVARAEEIVRRWQTETPIGLVANLEGKN